MYGFGAHWELWWQASLYRWWQIQASLFLLMSSLKVGTWKYYLWVITAILCDQIRDKQISWSTADLFKKTPVRVDVFAGVLSFWRLSLFCIKMELFPKRRSLQESCLCVCGVQGECEWTVLRCCRKGEQILGCLNRSQFWKGIVK